MNIIGFPSSGKKLELMNAQNDFFANKIDESKLLDVATKLKQESWEWQKNLSFVCVNDFSLYDNILDLSMMLGVIPERFRKLSGLERYFAMAKGYAKDGNNVIACKKTKWFFTRYYFVIPELCDGEYKIDIQKIFSEYNQAKQLFYTPKICLIGFFTYFGLAILNGIYTNEEKKKYFVKLKNTYLRLIEALSSLDKKVYIEFYEPIFSQESFTQEILFGKKKLLDEIEEFYNAITLCGVHAIITTSFGSNNEISLRLCASNVHGIGLDFVYGKKNLDILQEIADSGKKLYAGLIDGQNIWSADIDSLLLILDKISAVVPKDLIYISTSCSLIHVPYSKDSLNTDEFYYKWLSFAKEKIKEVELLESVFRYGITEDNKTLYEEKQQCIREKLSLKKYNPIIKQELFDGEMEIKKVVKKNRQTKRLAMPRCCIELISQDSLKPKNTLISCSYYKEDNSNPVISMLKESIKLESLAFSRNDYPDEDNKDTQGHIFLYNSYIQTAGDTYINPSMLYGDLFFESHSWQNASFAEYYKHNYTKNKEYKKIIFDAPLLTLSRTFMRSDIAEIEICKQVALFMNHKMQAIQESLLTAHKNGIIQINEILQSHNDYDKKEISSLLFAYLPLLTSSIIMPIYLYFQNPAIEALQKEGLYKLYSLGIDTVLFDIADIAMLEQTLHEINKDELPKIGIHLNLYDIIQTSHLTKMLLDVASILTNKKFYLHIGYTQNKVLDSKKEKELCDFFDNLSALLS